MKSVLCVCIGNGDRSPAMAAVLQLFLERFGNRVECESAGIGESAHQGHASRFAIDAAKRIGIHLSEHSRRHISSLDLGDYDLIVCASDEIAAKVIEAGASIDRVYTTPILNPWPCHFQEDYDETFKHILPAMYRVVTRYFSN